MTIPFHLHRCMNWAEEQLELAHAGRADASEHAVSAERLLLLLLRWWHGAWARVTRLQPSRTTSPRWTGDVYSETDFQKIRSLTSFYSHFGCTCTIAY